MNLVINMDKSSIIYCKKCGMPLKRGTRVCSYCRNKTGHSGHPVKSERQTRLRSWIPWVSIILIILNALTGLYKLAGGEYNIIYHYGMRTGALQRGELLRFILSGFLHGSWLHFISNMYALVIYGFVFENRIGRWKYLLIYIVSMLGSALLINFIGGRGIHIGASGAIWGLMAANLIYCLYTRKVIYLLYAVLSVAGNILYTFTHGVSWQGHFGGAIAGALVALILFAKEKNANGNRSARS